MSEEIATTTTKATRAPRITNGQKPERKTRGPALDRGIRDRLAKVAEQMAAELQVTLTPAQVVERLLRQYEQRAAGKDEPTVQWIPSTTPEVIAR